MGIAGAASFIVADALAKQWGWAVAFLSYVATTTSADTAWLTPAAVTTLTALLGTAASVSGNEIAIARGRARMVRGVGLPFFAARR